ncbi:hypothetical protein KY313_02195 [Candidatus Woesearchaeota archaeon]|jgi:hypothetical protein|nr:hypothetical protein [Candidatus Woesearchaeota archaeon]
MIKDKKTYLKWENDGFIENEEFYDARNIYSRNGTDHLLENDEISAEEEAFMNGWEEADTME